MALNRRWIKLGRLLMVAWLSFFIYPVTALLTTHFDRDAQVFGLAILLALALIWGWFWLRVVAGPDKAFAIPAVVAATGWDPVIGDGALNYRKERILETYYAYALTKQLTLTADYQLITNPAYNADRGPVHVFSGRFHGEF